MLTVLPFEYMFPWEYSVLLILYKYPSPQRLNMLTGGKVRFSHRLDFDDDHELQPDYERFGNHSEIWKYTLLFCRFEFFQLHFS
jgi:hypothetical protein